MYVQDRGAGQVLERLAAMLRAGFTGEALRPAYSEPMAKAG